MPKPIVCPACSLKLKVPAVGPDGYFACPCGQRLRVVPEKPAAANKTVLVRRKGPPAPEPVPIVCGPEHLVGAATPAGKQWWGDVPGPSEAPAPTQPPAPERRLRRWRMKLAAILLLVVAAGVGGAYLFERFRISPRRVVAAVKGAVAPEPAGAAEEAPDEADPPVEAGPVPRPKAPARKKAPTPDGDAAALGRGLRKANPEGRAELLRAIAAMGPAGRPAAADVIAIAAEASGDARVAALDCLEKVAPTLRGPVVALLVDKNHAALARAIADLGKLGPEATPALPLLAKFHDDQRASPAAIQYYEYYAPRVLAAMEAIGPKEEVFHALLVKVLSGDRGTADTPFLGGYHSAARLHAVAQAGRMAKAGHVAKGRLVAPLMAAAGGREWGGRAKAVAALGELGPEAKAAVPLLKRLGLDESAAVREAAAGALAKIE